MRVREGAGAGAEVVVRASAVRRGAVRFDMARVGAVRRGGFTAERWRRFVGCSAGTVSPSWTRLGAIFGRVCGEGGRERERGREDGGEKGDLRCRSDVRVAENDRLGCLMRVLRERGRYTTNLCVDWRWRKMWWG